ncbi:MAG: substrate-binding domain-containing protein [Christensenellaceae bacterium]|nr:substrate-binding domain-containing protein [Christensenellaceae bacterium]
MHTVQPAPAKAALTAFFRALCALLLVLPLSGCARPNSGLWLICSSSEGYYWQNLVDGVKQAAADHHRELSLHVLSEGEELQDLLAPLVRGGADLVLLALNRGDIPQDFYAPLPVVALGCELPSQPNLLGQYRNSEYFTGQETMQTLKREIGSQIEVLLVTGEESYLPDDAWEAELRREGGLGGLIFHERIVCYGDQDLANSGCKAALDAHPGVRAVICQNESATLGALRALREAGGSALILGRDINEEIAQGIEDGLVQVSYVTNAYALGYLGLSDQLSPRQDSAAPQLRVIDSIPVRAENLFSEQVVRLLFPME